MHLCQRWTRSWMPRSQPPAPAEVTHCHFHHCWNNSSPHCVFTSTVSASTAITPTSTSDIMVQHNKTGGITFWAALLKIFNYDSRHPGHCSLTILLISHVLKSMSIFSNSTHRVTTCKETRAVAAAAGGTNQGRNKVICQGQGSSVDTWVFLTAIVRTRKLRILQSTLRIIWSLTKVHFIYISVC